MIEALDIHVTGIVQGVGFRPFVYRLARRHLVNGWVLNAADGVTVHAEAERRLLDEFAFAIANEAPAAARVEEVELREAPVEGFGSFEIRFSDEAAVERTTLVSPDLATCDDCLRELFDPADRRFRYPFVNCTNCGPRFTITARLPYDRANTSMASFRMCPACAAEYADPADRRFHAQPDACWECGPKVSLVCRSAGPADAAGRPGLDAAGCPGFDAAGRPGASGGGGVEVVRGDTREASDEIFARAVGLLRAGGVLAVKGLGGFHLACDAENADAVALLRARKRRFGKPFAVMLPDLGAVRAVCEVSDEEAAVLSGTQRPIVLLRKRTDARFTPGLADGLAELGVMLPYTPVQHLLMRDFSAAGGRMLVMTSGNLHDEPIVIDDAEAVEKLLGIADGGAADKPLGIADAEAADKPLGIADALLGNDRPILARYDDSVVRVIDAGSAGFAVQVVRRARGLSPVPLTFRPTESLDAAGEPGTPPCDSTLSTRTEHASFGLSRNPAHQGAPRRPAAPTREPDSAEGQEPPTASALLAVGPEQKNTFCLVRPGGSGAPDEAFVSQHIGDMENAETADAWRGALARYEELFEIEPTALACDLHPEYLPSKWARETARAKGLPLVEVQHHHAHVASAMAEHGLEGPVVGFAFDGTGYGADGAVWGGEALIANLADFERLANFAYVPMPGGAAAIRNPLRMAYGALWAFDLLDHPYAARALEPIADALPTLGRMVEAGLNTPFTSSVGRLFDAASALLGLCAEPTYEGEPAVLLEAAMFGAPADPDPAAAARYEIAVEKNAATPESTARDTSVVVLDAAPAFEALLDDAAAGVPTGVIARRFHDAFVCAVVMVADLARALYGIDAAVLSGGVFMNRYLAEYAIAALSDAGFSVAVNRDLPPNDGCVSFGQAVVARRTLAEAR